MEGFQWALVRRVTIAPPSGHEFPSIETTEGEVFDVVGVPDDHVVPLRVSSRLDWLLRRPMSIPRPLTAAASEELPVERLALVTEPEREDWRD